MEGHFLVRMLYEDSISYDLVGAASKVLSMYHKNKIDGLNISLHIKISVRIRYLV